MTAPSHIVQLPLQKDDRSFEDCYLSLRRSEGRLYDDDMVRSLPFALNLPHAAEWKLRANSCRKLVHFLSQKRKPLRILEVGCGNGWLAHRLSGIKHATVTGVDINLLELNQARRVFAGIANLHFTYGDIGDTSWKGSGYDIIVFAASIQYFPDLPAILCAVLDRLHPTGEVHIIDTHFYPPRELEAARQRSDAYFHRCGIHEMSRHYFHHSIQALQPFRYRLLYNPKALQHTFQKNKNPFPWILIPKLC